MARIFLSTWILLAPAAFLLATTGCGSEVKTVQRTERVEESQPEMVSPGDEIVE